MSATPVAQAPPARRWFFASCPCCAGADRFTAVARTEDEVVRAIEAHVEYVFRHGFLRLPEAQ